MGAKEIVSNIRNTVDFFLRSSIPWGFPIAPDTPMSDVDTRIQREFEEFLSLFNWKAALSTLPPATTPLTVADIGARNFSFGPVLDRHFRTLGYEPEVHGIELDAYRRLINFHTRADYGEYFAKKIKHGHFHPIDFLQWSRPLHVAFLMNPFVTEEALLAWGLPLSQLKPYQIFEHAYHRVKPCSGIVVLSNPHPEEVEISYKIARAIGFRFGEEQYWEPANPVKYKPRYGVILYPT
jgi:hypothetical protein